MDMTDFVSRLRAQRTTRVSFKLLYPYEETVAMLRAAVRNEVEYWGGSLVDDNDDYIRQVARWLVSPATPGLTIFGNVGNGKTTIATAVMQTINVLNLGRDAAGQPIWVNMISARELARKARNDEEDMLGWCKKPMLVLDDVGAEQDTVRTYGNILNPVEQLIEYRYKYRLFTVVTTNLKPQEIRERYGDRIADRMNEMMTRIIIKVPSYRTKGTRQ